MRRPRRSGHYTGDILRHTKQSYILSLHKLWMFSLAFCSGALPSTETTCTLDTGLSSLKCFQNNFFTTVSVLIRPQGRILQVRHYNLIPRKGPHPASPLATCGWWDRGGKNGGNTSMSEAVSCTSSKIQRSAIFHGYIRNCLESVVWE